MVFSILRFCCGFNSSKKAIKDDNFHLTLKVEKLQAELLRRDKEFEKVSHEKDQARELRRVEQDNGETYAPKVPKDRSLEQMPSFPVVIVPISASRSSFDSDSSYLSAIDSGHNSSEHISDLSNSDKPTSNEYDNHLLLTDLTSINESRYEIVDEISELGDSPVHIHNPQRLRRMPTPLVKIPPGISTQTYEALFDKDTGRPRNDPRTKAIIESMRRQIRRNTE